MRVWLTVLVALMPALGAAQGSTAALTPWGAPDLQGIWDFRSLTPMERPSNLAQAEFATAKEAAEFEQETLRRKYPKLTTLGGDKGFVAMDEEPKIASTRTSLIVDPPDGRIPLLTPEAEKKRAARRNVQNGWLDPFSASTRCIVGANVGPPITPYINNNMMRLVQARDYIVILTEMVHEARIVPLDSRPHLPQEIPQWLGDSRGHWEGPTLVVETTNFRDDDAPFDSSKGVRLVERFTRVSDETLTYEVTVNDPATWTKPWTFSLPMVKTSDLMYEYACHEGNYDILSAILVNQARADQK